MQSNTQVGPYIYLPKRSERLGEGGFGQVFKCTDTRRPHLPLCIKIIPFLPNQRAKQEREFQILTNLKDIFNNNENLVRIEDCFMEKDHFSIVMERCEGSLASLTFSPQQALSIISQIVNGYKVLFDNNIIHRDIKPANILYVGNKYKLADFGLARVLDCAEKDMSRCGTPGYCAPEVLLKQGYDSQADIFSLGMTFYWLIYGQRPINGNTQTVLLKETLKIKNLPIRLWKPINGLTQPVRNLIESMLRYHVQERINWQTLFQHPLLNQSIPMNYQEQQMGIEESNHSITIRLLGSSFDQKTLMQREDQNTVISIEQFDPLNQIQSYDVDQTSSADQYYLGSIIQKTALIFLVQNGELKIQNICDFYTMALFLCRSSINMLAFANQQKAQLPYEGKFSMEQIENELQWWLSVLNQLSNEIQNQVPNQIDYLLCLIAQIERTSGIEFYKTKLSLFSYDHSQQYSQSYIQYNLFQLGYYIFQSN